MTGPLPPIHVTTEPPPSPTPAAPHPPAPDTRSRRPFRFPTGRARLAIVGLAGLLVIALIAVDRRGGDAPPADDQAVRAMVDDKIAKAVEGIESAPAHSAAVYQTILPSIVVIRSQRTGTADDGSGLGTGVVVKDDGSIMTALHVVDGATSLRVTFADGTVSDASVVSADKATDIAVLTPATKPEVIVPAVLGGGTRIGDEAFAVGHPLGLVGSLSSGVISGLNRSIPREDGAGTLDGLIQFDAAVNPGNSGGPLLNRAGQVVGIVTAIADPSRDGSFIGIGFAVPIATAGGTAGAPPQ